MKLMSAITGKDISPEAGSGAAGGLGAGFVGLFRQSLKRNRSRFGLLGAKSYIQQADLVIVGEGRLTVKVRMVRLLWEWLVWPVIMVCLSLRFVGV